MKVIAQKIPDVLLLVPDRFDDGRGHFSETYNAKRFSANGVADHFVQDNQSLSKDVGVVRGLHYQLAPSAQVKLVRVLRGRIFDVAVDIRQGSPSFGQHVSVELDAQVGAQLYIPAGFAHGFMTLQPDTEVLYKVSDYYAPDHDRGICWDDESLEIQWPFEAIGGKDKVLLSEKDSRHSLWDRAKCDFTYSSDQGAET